MQQPSSVERLQSTSGTLITGGQVLAIILLCGKTEQLNADGRKNMSELMQREVTLTVSASVSRGDFMTETMSETQKNAGKELVTDLKKKYGISKVQKHSDVCATSCPGKNFPFSEIAGATSSSSSTSKPAASASKKEQLKVDGWWGKDTTKRLQRIFKTPVDGIVSNQDPGSEEIFAQS